MSAWQRSSSPWHGPVSHMRLLFNLSLSFLMAHSGAACTAEQTEALNALHVNDKLAKYANEAIAGRLPRTLGDCSGAAAKDESLQPCHPLPVFPITGRAFNLEYSINYLTHVDTFYVQNISARCSSNASSAPGSNTTDEGQWFAMFGSSFAKLSVGATIKVLFPHFKLEAPCTDKGLCLAQFEEVPFRAAARIQCLGPELLGLRVDPTVGIQMGKPMALTWHEHSINFTNVMSEALGQVLEQVELPCPEGGPALFCRALCAASLPAPLAKAMDSLLMLV
eukprot:TRINITY_DN4791_c0_g2_i1.p1 TRINITY_DN4791_c0_g2~~TRINITY_DN4791_c0_g2_i1.p1  ORF type:complete len:306 (-),score=56.47 TRINITY_DN4791_c0_g2_i1:170-1006(-)